MPTRITHIRTLLCSAPQRDVHMPSRTMRSAAFIVIETDSGQIGIGETYAGYFVPEMVPAVVDFYAPILTGADPMELDALCRRMFIAGKFWGRVGLGSIVMSGIEMALLDLKGKLLGVPVYELLGGRCHESLPCYATGGPSNRDRDALEAKVECYLALGYHAVKLGGGLWAPGQPTFSHRSAGEAAAVEVEKVAFLEKRFGTAFRLMLDGHMDNLSDTDTLWDEGTAAIVLNALAAHRVDFFEEPLPYTDRRAYQALRRRAAIPVAGGECLTSLEEWRDWLEAEPFDLAQLDASFMGGLMNFVKIARLCELQGLGIATHAWSATVGAAGNLHAAFACRNTRIVEMAAYHPGRADLNGHLVAPLITDLWVEPPTLRDGRLSLAETPGLGIRLPEEIVTCYPYQPGTGEFNSVKGKILTT